MENIPLGLLGAFLAFCESKNISEAAARLGISQPALSKQLQQLERAAQEPLFTLQGRRKALTPFGRAFLVPGARRRAACLYRGCLILHAGSFVPRRRKMSHGSSLRG